VNRISHSRIDTAHFRWQKQLSYVAVTGDTRGSRGEGSPMGWGLTDHTTHARHVATPRVLGSCTS
jgi:hypothetical protein